LYSQIIPDDNFREKINEHLGQPADYQPTMYDLNNMTGVLDATAAQITSISGAQYLERITELYLGYNLVDDLSSLSGLTNLTRVILTSNSGFSDLTPLSTLSDLYWLDLSYNALSDITPLSTLTNLTYLDLEGTGLADISPLSTWINLDNLDLSYNNICDLRPLTGLSNLSGLSLIGNKITDIYPLIMNIGLGQGDTLFLTNNPLSMESITTFIPILLVNNFYMFEWQSTPNNNAPCYPNPVREEMDFSPSNMLSWYGNTNDVNITYNVWLGDTPESLVNIGVGTHLSGTDYTFQANLAPDTEYWWKIQAISTTDGVLWSGVWHFTTNNQSLIPDTNLKTCVNARLGQPADYEPTSIDLQSITGSFEANTCNIQDINGIQFLTSIDALNLADNNITDINPLVTLNNLIYLNLANNSIDDIASISNLENLETLKVGGNAIADISALSDLEYLISLDISDNLISDISPISNLLALNELSIVNNRVSDLFPLIENTGIGDGSVVIEFADICLPDQPNPISYEGLTVFIPILQQRNLTNSAFPTDYNGNSPCFPNPARDDDAVPYDSPLQWQGNIDRTANYEVWLGMSPDNLFSIGYGSLLSDDIYSISHFMTQFTDYWWKVRAIYDDEEIWSGLWHFTTSNLTSIDNDTQPNTSFSHLYNAYPNPFNPATTIELNIKTGETGDLNIYNIKGQSLVNQKFQEGRHTFNWDAEQYPSGVYFYRLKTNSITETRKMAMLK
jgi:internalin A